MHARTYTHKHAQTHFPSSLASSSITLRSSSLLLHLLWRFFCSFINHHTLPSLCVCVCVREGGWEVVFGGLGVIVHACKVTYSPAETHTAYLCAVKTRQPPDASSALRSNLLSAGGGFSPRHVRPATKIKTYHPPTLLSPVLQEVCSS